MTFINPYSFVALRPRVKPDPEELDEKRYTGVIDYSLMTKTPLIIPNTSNDDAFKCGVEDHRSYDFYSYTDLSMRKDSCAGEYHCPVIPGSEIRGMFRSYFEILTNSCLSAVDEKRVLAKRTNQVFSAGLIKREPNGNYSLYKAIDHLMRTQGANSLVDKHPYSDVDHDYLKKTYIQDTIPEGSKVFFDEVHRGAKIKPLATNVSLRNTGGQTEGFILKGAEGPVMTSHNPKVLRQEKHCAHIFTVTGECISKKVDIEILETALEEYEKAMSLSTATVYPYGEYRANFEQFRKGLGYDCFPVYYSKVTNSSKHIMLSPASITREISDKRLGDIIKSHAPCNQADSLCPACRLFGTLRDSFSVSTRIRFSDLEYIGGSSWQNAYDAIKTLPELSSPKLSNVEFYVKRPHRNAWFWTYDYYITENGSPIPYAAEINGRKVYWHHKTLKLDPNEVKGNRNMTVRPLRANQAFKGKLYFNDITKTELDTLIYLLNAGESSDTPISNREHGYKIGAAKPIGFGSVAVKVDAIHIRTISMSDGQQSIMYEENLYTYYVEPQINESIKADFSKITAFNAITEDNLLKYPCIGNPAAGEKPLIYEWFVANHVAYDSKTHKKLGMLNSRSQMAYREYMEPLKIELSSTGYDDKYPPEKR